MATGVSPYYPPRARWFKRPRYWWDDLKRLSGWQRVHLPNQMPLRVLALSLALPGYSFVVAGQKRAGQVLMLVAAAGALLFLVAFGHRASSLGLVALLSTHASSVAHLCSAWRAWPGLRGRLAATLVILAALYFGVYSPFRGWVHRHWALPLNVAGRLVVVRPSAAGPVTRGTVLAYRMADRMQNGIYVREGFGLGEVLAVGGDYVSFTTNGVVVHGRLSPLEAGMPRSGELLVPQKHWFIWPKFAIDRYGAAAQTNVSEVLVAAAVVSETQFIGQPYERWWGRRQLLP